MFRLQTKSSSILLFYAKPAQGYISQLPKMTGHMVRQTTDEYLRPVGHAVPDRRNILELQQQREEQKSAVSSTETAVSMENNWTNESTETVGVTEETYAKWFCEHYNITRDQYEREGCPNTGPSVKSLKNNCDADQTLLAEKQNSVPELVLKEMYSKKIYMRFHAATLKGDGEPVEENNAAGEAEPVPSDDPQLESGK